MNVVVAAPVYRRGTYILDRFLANQRDIQREYPSCELVLATNEVDLARELDQQFDLYGLRGMVISYETVKPDYARNKIWNIACGREALRKYMLLHTEAKYYLSVDTDMVYDPGVIERLQHEIQNYDVVFSGYEMRDYGIGLAGAGCIMLNRATMAKVGLGEKARFVNRMRKVKKIMSGISRVGRERISKTGRGAVQGMKDLVGI